jgi:hypothetical protein
VSGRALHSMALDAMHIAGLPASTEHRVRAGVDNLAATLLMTPEDWKAVSSRPSCPLRSLLSLDIENKC